MDAVEGRVNWSAVAAEAFRRKLVAAEQRRQDAAPAALHHEATEDW
jgi:hypothetical protein